VLVAFDKFKGALDADRACEVVRRVIERARPSFQVDTAPLTDGGDGFCRILTRAASGQFHDVHARGPLFDREGGSRLLQVSVGVVELGALPDRARQLLELDAGARRLAVIEMAAINGLALVPRERMDVWRSSSYGTGELILAAKQLGVDAILLGVGGSATSDLGLGALSALGLELTSAEGELQSPPVPALWPHGVAISGAIGAGLPPLRIACDVDSPVFGPHGAAAVYGPQKGLAAADLPRFEAEGRRLAALLCRHLGVGAEQLTRPGAGAAGGIAFGLAAALGARIVSGSALVAEWLGLDERLRAADWVLTGEGRFDESSGSGKGPGAVVARARAADRPCVVFAGSIAPELLGAAAADPLYQLVAITEPGTPLERAMAETEQNLQSRVEEWLRTLDGEN
jgi:glycerate kinase